MNPDDQHLPPPKYVMLSENQGSLRPPPYRRNIPRYHSKDHGRSGGFSCLRCICCFYGCLFIFIFILAAVLICLFIFLKPRAPSYKVDKFDVRTFDVKPDFSLITEFLVTVKAQNPNENIGFGYGKDSEVDVIYTGSKLCSGQIPSFVQPQKNTTEIDVVLKGKTKFGSGMQAALMENRHTGKIPLLVLVNVPVRIVLGHIQLREFVFKLNCSLVVDNLAPNKKVQIISSSYAYEVEYF
ncbi:Late embryogenesis abundant (LEA) hydroxyproline-rich glycoprotein family [Quillaja saponaria]|uniref:Late embryogenesis abundant (LEA) hydroxyproline-rich glycoprotein family n=1 Tax=Quillaja saponaria TaxID=32244 RepID=A0AAD7KZZ7_QUISA|nr:Late embryogenesis abundant (LEA) hydroxyproline-rich glycoprotein family [Quillaja saponaria]